MKMNDIYPLIIMDYYPLRISMNEDKNSIFMCNNIEDVETLLTQYHKEIGQIIRNIKIIPEKEEISFDVADVYFQDNYELEEEDWYNKTISYETLKIFKNGNTEKS